MQFYAPYFLNLLWLAPVLALCFIASGWLTQKRVRSFLKTAEIQGKLLPHYSKNEWPIRAVLLFMAFIFSVIALSQPQWGEEKKKIERKGVDVIFMLDVSTSMLAEDTKPSRVQKAKFEIESFVKSLKGDRVGMVTFAGTSFMQTPLTLDYSAFLIFLAGVDVGHVPDPGTSLGPAIQKAIEAFPDEKGKHRALIVFSDGEDHEMQLDPAMDIAKKKNVRIYTIGTGSAEGAPIPLKDERGNQTAVKKDRGGNIVITKLNKELLAKVSAETGGIYLPATPGEKEIDFILKHLSTLDQKKLEDRTVTEREDHYQIFVFLAFVCLLLEMLVLRGKSSRMTPLSALIFVFLLHSGFIITPQQKVDEGNQDFEGKKYQSAVQKYREVQVKNPDSPPVEYNLATSLYKVEQFQESAAHLKNAYEKSSKDPALQAKAAYNYGNALYRVGDYEGAIASYKKAVELNPQDKDAKYNLEFLLNKKNKFEKENEDRKKNNPEKKNDKNQQNKQKDKQSQGGGSSQDKNQSSGGQKNDKNQGGGGGDKQDKSDGKNDQNQQGSGQKDQSKNQGGDGQNQNNSGKSQDPNQKDQGQGQNQQDDTQQGNQSNPNKDPNPKSGGQGEKDQKENQTQNEKNKGDQQGQNQNKDQAGPQQNSGGQGDQKDQGNDPNSNPEQNQQGKNPSEQDPNQQGQSGNQNHPQQKPDNQSSPKDQNSQNQGGGPNQQPGQQPKPSDKDQKPGQGSGGAGSGEKGAESGMAGGKPLQGQMSKQDAEYLLDSLEDGEKKFHVLRKPATETAEQPYVEKDW